MEKPEMQSRILNLTGVAELVLAMVWGYPSLLQVGTGTEAPVLVRNRQGTRPAVSSRVCYPDQT